MILWRMKSLISGKPGDEEQGDDGNWKNGKIKPKIQWTIVTTQQP